VTESAELAVDSAVSPEWVLPRQPQHQVADVLAGPRTTRPVRVRPFACDQPTVPGQQRPRRDQPVGAQHRWQQVGQRSHDGTAGPARRGPGDLTAEHRDLMTEHHDFRVLGCLAAAKQRQPAEDPDHDQVDQAKGHKPRSCRNRPIRPLRRSRHLRRVLKRYTVVRAEANYGRATNHTSSAASAQMTTMAAIR